MPEGYAVKSFGVINVATVSTTERAAKVNFLVTNGVFVTNDRSDEYIDQMFGIFLEEDGEIIVKLVKVNITEVVT
jgi:hypothetical protein